MPSPKKKKTIAHTEPSPGKAATPTPKSKVISMLALAPHHPVWAQLNDPENEGRVWVVEFANPPGVFMARSVPDTLDMDEFYDEMHASYRALNTGKPRKTRYTLGMGYCGAHARRLVEALTRDLRDLELPFSESQLNEIHGTFRVVQ